MASRLARRTDARMCEAERRLGTSRWAASEYQTGRYTAWARHKVSPWFGYADFSQVYDTMRLCGMRHMALGYISMAQTLRRQGRIGV